MDDKLKFQEALVSLPEPRGGARRRAHYRRNAGLPEKYEF